MSCVELSKITERFPNVCGQIGVITNALTRGPIIGPPAERLYAVDPVGVETINPSAQYVFK